ncbi:hypothetical protein SAMN03159496_06038 [Rhizobium sp. NFR07]|nr:hypothetical protein SAMN03159496_06038 [Rhizobium sp. NFR07]
MVGCANDFNAVDPQQCRILLLRVEPGEHLSQPHVLRGKLFGTLAPQRLDLRVDTTKLMEGLSSSPQASDTEWDHREIALRRALRC